MEEEAIEIHGPHSFHIPNYNSPGAKGAPAYPAYFLHKFAANGYPDHLRPNPKAGPCSWNQVTEGMGLAG